MTLFCLISFMLELLAAPFSFSCALLAPPTLDLHSDTSTKNKLLVLISEEAKLRNKWSLQKLHYTPPTVSSLQFNSSHFG